MNWYWPIYCLDSGSADSHQRQWKTRSRSLVDERKSLYCNSCMQLVCFKNEAVGIHGRHEHVFINPAGVMYRIACYANAPGCNAIGTPTSEYTWFTDYEWQIAVCVGCSEHLGWMFTGVSVFFGLICDRLVENVNT